MAIVKSSKNVKRRELWIRRKTSEIKKKWLYHQYFHGDIYYLQNIKYRNKIGLINFNRKKKSQFLINRIYSWKFLRQKCDNFKSALVSIPFIVI